MLCLRHVLHFYTPTPQHLRYNRLCNSHMLCIDVCVRESHMLCLWPCCASYCYTPLCYAQALATHKPLLRKLLLHFYTPTHTLQYLPNKCPISILTAYNRYILRTQTVCKRHTKAYWQAIASVGGGVGLRRLRLAHSIAHSHAVRLTEQAIVLCTNFCSKQVFCGRVIFHHETTNTLKCLLRLAAQ